MSSEGVKQYGHDHRGFLVEMSGGGLVQFNDYAALEAECERLRNAPCECGAPVGYVSGDKYAAEHERLRECRAERNALSAELAALKAASGEEVEVPETWRDQLLRENPNSDPDYWPEELIVNAQSREIADWRAQHQRITAALRAEVKKLRKTLIEVRDELDFDDTVRMNRLVAKINATLTPAQE